jgi:hypothetical protein
MNVLLVGTEEWNKGVRQALPGTLEKGLSGVNKLWDLYALPQAVSVDVAVFQQLFPAHDLRYATEYLRRRWPDAVILIIGKQAEELDDPLYDHRVSSGISFEELAGMIEMSAAAKKRVMRNARSGLIYTRS